jgi:GT2 family glycosyltransferase
MTANEPNAARVAVVVLSYNQRVRTLECLEHLYADSAVPFRVLVWDNGSGDGTIEAVRAAYPEVVGHQHSENLGVAGGRNAAAKLAIRRLDPTHLLFLDNDIVVEPGFVSGLLEPFLSDDRVGQTQAKLRFMGDRERLNDGGGCRISFVLGRTVPVGYGEIDRGQYDAVTPCVACGGAMMVRRELFEQLGGFDTGYGHAGPEDLDFSLRLAKAGHRALYAPAAVGYHEVSHTYGKGYGEQYARLKARNWFRFMRRHASVAQQLGFFLVGAPYRVARLVVREARRRNLGAIRGLVRGAIDSVRVRPR